MTDTHAPSQGGALDPPHDVVPLDGAVLLVFREAPLGVDCSGYSRSVEDLVERVYGNRVPAVVLGPGMKVDVIRDGGWTYADEREPHVSEEVEVALTDWGFLGRPVTIGHWGEWKGRAYAWRPAPVPPPVRRAGPVEPDIPQRAPSPAAQYRELMRGRPDGDPAKGERPLTYAEVAALEGLE